MLISIFYFLIEKCPSSLDNHEIYLCCKLIINLFKRLFSLFPTLKAQLGSELNQMLNKVITHPGLEKNFAHKIILEIIATSQINLPLSDFFSKLPSDLLIQQLLKNGNIFQFDSDKTKDLFSQTLVDLVASKPYLSNKYYINVVNLIRGFLSKDYNEWILFLVEQSQNYKQSSRLQSILQLFILSILAIQQVISSSL